MAKINGNGNEGVEYLQTPLPEGLSHLDCVVRHPLHDSTLLTLRVFYLPETGIDDECVEYIIDTRILIAQQNRILKDLEEVRDGHALFFVGSYGDLQHPDVVNLIAANPDSIEFIMNPFEDDESNFLDAVPDGMRRFHLEGEGARGSTFVFQVYTLDDGVFHDEVIYRDVGALLFDPDNCDYYDEIMKETGYIRCFVGTGDQVHYLCVDRFLQTSERLHVNMNMLVYEIGEFGEFGGISEEEAEDILGAPTPQEKIQCENVGCLICLESFETCSEMKQLPCQHVFHHGCILQWTKLKTTCPVCRAEYDLR